MGSGLKAVRGIKGAECEGLLEGSGLERIWEIVAVVVVAVVVVAVIYL